MRQSPYRVNWETTSNSPRTSVRERFHQPLVVFKDAQVLDLVDHPGQVLFGVAAVDAEQNQQSLGNGAGDLLVDLDARCADALNNSSHGRGKGEDGKG